jgi:hypothetical protein
VAAYGLPALPEIPSGRGGPAEQPRNRSPGRYLSVSGPYVIHADEPTPARIEAELPDDHDLASHESLGEPPGDELNPVRLRILDHVVTGSRTLSEGAHRTSRLHLLALVRLLLGYETGEGNGFGLHLLRAGANKEQRCRGEWPEDHQPA